MSEVKRIQDLIDAFEERMKKKHEAEEKREAEIAEKARQDYLRRTGRKEMKP